VEKVVTKDAASRQISPMFALATAAIWAVVWLALGLTPVPNLIDTSLVRKIEFAVRSATGNDVLMAESLRIIALDDSSYAALGKPNLTEDQWSKLLTSLAAQDPKAIFTTHMFGSGEFSDRSGPLAQALTKLRDAKIPVKVAAFAYPGLIRHRTPLSLTGENFDLQRMIVDEKLTADQVTKIRELTVEKKGWNLYGPSADFSDLFSELGHVHYDGHGKIAPLARFRGDRVVPYLGILAGGHLSINQEQLQSERSSIIPIDDSAELIVNELQPSLLGEYSWSMNAIFKRIEDNTLAEVIRPGDTVLLLSDMYTGRVSFVPSPRGTVPSGYVVASVINSALTDQWIKAPDIKLLTISLTAVLAATAFLFASGISSGIKLALGLILIPATGLCVFSLQHTVIPWFGMLFVYGATGISVTYRRALLNAAADRNERRQQAAESSKLTAVVRTTQMLAHDIRRPFSLVETAMQALRMEVEPRKLQQLVAKLAPEVMQAKSSVEAMLADIVDIDNNAAPNLQPTGPGDLVLQALHDAFAVNNGADVEISGRLRNTLEIMAERGRLVRVMTNIIENAVQVMENKGHLWINTEDVHDMQKSYVRFCIGNSGSYIPEADQKRIFEAFFTKGKVGGTGLGLAIAKKIVTAHGGKIWCESTQEKGTEFWFTVAAAYSTPRPETAKLPGSGKEAAGLKTQFVQPLMAVVDDSPFVLEAWQLTVRDAKVLAFDSPEGFWKEVDRNPSLLGDLDCIVTDYHFDEGTKENGMTFAGAVRAKLPKGKQVLILISTDGIINLDPLDKTIDGQIPKQPLAFGALRSARKSAA